jgi:hypothetical protein
MAAYIDLGSVLNVVSECMLFAYEWSYGSSSMIEQTFTGFKLRFDSLNSRMKLITNVRSILCDASLAQLLDPNLAMITSVGLMNA